MLINFREFIQNKHCKLQLNKYQSESNNLYRQKFGGNKLIANKKVHQQLLLVWFSKREMQFNKECPVHIRN